ncbi:MAG TPA: hypothetical protein VGL81_36645 [Polyangiaceae bacterium]|jgi:hypothetical protein
MPAPGIHEQDDLDELPPLDGDARDAPEPEPEAGELIGDDGDASMDDSTGEDDPVDADDLEVDERDGGWLEEPADAPDLDLGDVAVVDFGGDAPAAEDADEPGVGDEDFGLGDGPERGGLDGGDEGPVGADEELREADLPQLDADEEGDLDDAALVDASFAADEPVGLPWAAEPWVRVGAPVPLASASAVACAGRGALAAGRDEGRPPELVRIDLEGTAQSLATAGLDAGSVRALAVEGEVVAALVERGRLMLSHDGGATFTPTAEGLAATDVALAAGALWVRTASGRLAVVRGGAVDIEAVELEPPAAGSPSTSVRAMTRDAGGGVAALVADDAGRVSGLVRARGTNDGVVEHETLDGPDRVGLRAVLAVRGIHVAYAGRRGGVVRRGADGTWATHAWEGRVTALAFVDDAGTLVAATYSESDDTTALVCLEPARPAGAGAGEPRAEVVARIGPARAQAGGGDAVAGADDGVEGLDTDARVLALAHDDARGVVWVAGGFGVAVFAVR